jgi:hypothetical protein
MRLVMRPVTPVVTEEHVERGSTTTPTTLVIRTGLEVVDWTT